MSINLINVDKTDYSYETIWKALIRPQRDFYKESSLVNKSFDYHNKKYKRTAYELINKRGLILKCSLIEPERKYRTTEKMPIVIYCHGNSSSQMEAMEIIFYLLDNDINLFCFDFAGSGLSEGEYISLGFYEKDDLSVVVDFVSQLPTVSKIGLWGRSMGAATVLLYAWRNPQISCLVVDSPFAELKVLVQQLGKKYENIPNWITNIGFFFVKNTIKSKIDVDLENINPIDYAKKTKIPLFLIHAMNDELIPLEHSVKIYELYKGKKSLNVVEGTHNSKRKTHLTKKIMVFFKKYLYGIETEIFEEESKNKNEGFK